MKEARAIMKPVAVSSVKSERASSMCNMTTEEIHCLKNIYHLTAVKLLGKLSVEWNTTPCIKSRLSQEYDKTNDNRIRQTVKPDYQQHQMACLEFPSSSHFICLVSLNNSLY
jgi:hypothetical protein